jgi:hypothetical protein
MNFLHIPKNSPDGVYRETEKKLKVGDVIFSKIEINQKPPMICCFLIMEIHRDKYRDLIISGIWTDLSGTRYDYIGLMNMQNMNLYVDLT